MTLRRDLHHDVSLPLRELIRTAPMPSLVKREAEPVRHIPLPPGLASLSEDPVRQRTAVPFTPTVSQSFEGLGQGQYGFTVTGAPPDTNGAVGITQYVQWVNTSFAVFSKSTGALIAGPTAGNTLWSGFGGGCQTNNDGDPIVLYDRLADRWVFSQFSVSTGPFLQCVAISTTSDATGTYNRYSFQYNNLDDYPKMGIWPDAYYETFNMFDSTGTMFLGSDVCAYNRTAMLNGTAATQICFQQNSSVGGLLPSDLDGTTPPPVGSPNYMVFYGTNNLNLYRFHADFVTPSNSTFTGPTVINVAAFSPLCGGGTCVPQPGTTNQLDSLADRLMYRLAYRNFATHESLVVNHSVAAGGGGGVRWYEIQNPGGTPTLAQQGTFAPDSSYRWMGSIAMDKAGDIAVGYSVSDGSSVFPSIAFTGRLVTDPSGTMGTETIVTSGTGSQLAGGGPQPLTRWGDYSAMQVDPVDDCTFWYTQEYIKTNGSFNWNTRIANFKFPNCTTAAAMMSSPTPGNVLPGASVTFQWTAGMGVTQYWLYVGSTPGGAQYYNQSTGTTQQATVSNLPTNGNTIYVQLWSLINGIWQSNRYSYTAATTQPATMTSPPNGSTLAGSSATFQWTAGMGVTQYWLYVGSTPGGAQYYNQSTGTTQQATVSNLPTNGNTIYVQLWSLINGGWQSNNYTYTAATVAQPQPATMTSPPNGSTLMGSSVTFQWTAGTGVTQYWLYVGSTPGGAQYFTQSTGTTRQATVSNLPTNGSIIYVQLWSLINGTWQSNSYTYTAATVAAPQPATMTSPLNGSTLVGSSVTFQWTAGTGVTQYWLYVGSTPGGAQYFNQSTGTTRQAVVSTLPANGSTLYVQLWSLINGTWQWTSSSYISGP